MLMVVTKRLFLMNQQMIHLISILVVHLKNQKKKRDPSFSGVIDLFDDDEAAEMGFGPNAPKDPEPNSYAIPQKHKRDPSYTGVKDLFSDEFEEEQNDFGF